MSAVRIGFQVYELLYVDDLERTSVSMNKKNMYLIIEIEFGLCCVGVVVGNWKVVAAKGRGCLFMCVGEEATDPRQIRKEPIC